MSNKYDTTNVLPDTLNSVFRQAEISRIVLDGDLILINAPLSEQQNKKLIEAGLQPVN
ncbi:MAG: hypothetical protein H6861_03330 [Rhodospirillales bacterium]|nr:hypothetical protein [Rhodospirillales bacterium]